MIEFFRKNKLALAGFLVVVALTIAAVFAPWLAPYDPASQKLPDRLEGPSWDHPFGNDELGRDILSRILLGTRVSMRVGATVVLLSVIAGVLIGGFAGYIGGKLDKFVTVLVINSLEPPPAYTTAPVSPLYPCRRWSPDATPATHTTTLFVPSVVVTHGEPRPL